MRKIHKNRQARRNEQAAQRQAQKEKRMREPRGTSPYALKKKNGYSPGSPFFEEAAALPAATPLPPPRKWYETWH